MNELAQACLYLYQNYPHITDPRELRAVMMEFAYENVGGFEGAYGNCSMTEFIGMPFKGKCIGDMDFYAYHSLTDDTASMIECAIDDSMEGCHLTGIDTSQCMIVVGASYQSNKLRVAIGGELLSVECDSDEMRRILYAYCLTESLIQSNKAKAPKQSINKVLISSAMLDKQTEDTTTWAHNNGGFVMKLSNYDAAVDAVNRYHAAQEQQ